MGHGNNNEVVIHPHDVDDVRADAARARKMGIPMELMLEARFDVDDVVDLVERVVVIQSLKPVIGTPPELPFLAFALGYWLCDLTDDGIVVYREEPWARMGADLEDIRAQNQVRIDHVRDDHCMENENPQQGE